MDLSAEEKFMTTKDALNKMLERADADQTTYDKIDSFLSNLRVRDSSLLGRLANPQSGLNPFIRALVKLQLPASWYHARTEEEIARGGKRRSRKNIKKRYAKNT